MPRKMGKIVWGENLWVLHFFSASTTCRLSSFYAGKFLGALWFFNFWINSTQLRIEFESYTFCQCNSRFFLLNSSTNKKKLKWKIFVSNRSEKWKKKCLWEFSRLWALFRNFPAWYISPLHRELPIIISYYLWICGSWGKAMKIAKKKMYKIVVEFSTFYEQRWSYSVREICEM